MSFLELSLGDVKEPEYAPEGDGYPLLVAKSEVVENKAQTGHNVKLYIIFDGMPDYAGISHYLSLPNKDDDEQTVSMKMLMIKRFLVAFDIPHEENGFDPELIQGAIWSNGTVGLDEYEGRIKNVLILPPLPNEK